MNDDDPARGVRQFALGAVMFVCVAVLGIQAAGNAEMMADSGLDPGPAFLPVLMLYILGASSLYLIAEGLYRLRRAGWRVEISAESLKSFIFPTLMVLSLIVYVGLVDLFGFLVLSLVLCVAWTVVLVAQDHGLRQLRPLLFGAGGAVLVVAVIYLLFREVIGVPLS